MNMFWFKNVFYPIAMTILLISSCVMLYVGYLLIYPYKVVDPKNLPWKVTTKNIEAGGKLSYIADNCKYLPLEARVTREYIRKDKIGNIVVDSQEQLISNLSTGCHKTERPIVVPISLTSGTYYIRITAKYQVNPLRHMSYVFYTEDFNVSNPIIEGQ